jgi:putative ATPase
MADGDGRAVLTLAEEVWRAAREGELFDTEGCVKVVQRRAPVYDKGQDGHYNLISALHKAVRGSDPDAALYYLARMFDAGEDPLLSRQAIGADGIRRYRSCRPAGAGHRQRGQGCL